MANTLDANDPLVAWTSQQGNHPTDAQLSAPQLATRQRSRQVGNVVLASALPSKTAQTAAGIDYDKADAWLFVAADAATATSYRNGTVDPVAGKYATWKAANSY